MATPIHFYLNDQEVHSDAPPGLLVLDFLRRRARLTGTKEGCKEGDCGACAVLVGTLQNGAVHYKAVTSCLMPLGELHGKHLVTVEGLNLPDLTPVQDQIVIQGGSQCGFCTPGIVVSLSGMLLEKGPAIERADIKTALSGHLCRCTGYASLLRAGEGIIQAAQKLPRSSDGKSRVEAMIDQGMLPAYFQEMPAKLKALTAGRPAPGDGKIQTGLPIAGGTDLYVQQGEAIPGQSVAILNLHPEMLGIRRDGNEIRVGALTTFEEFAANAQIQKALPEIRQYMHWIASLQIRNRATLGGNIVNASPIGDMTILLLALNTRLTLKDGTKTRSLPLKDFYQGYKQLAKRKAEIVSEIVFPIPAASMRINYEKVSKRKCLDISSVTSAARITHRERTIVNIDLSLGGVAPVPLYLQQTGAFLTGREITSATLAAALAVLQEEIAPISDIRGSAAYKRLLARQLILAHFTKLFPEYLSVREVLGAVGFVNT